MADMDENRKRQWQLARTVLLLLTAIVLIAAAYRFASHGISLHDNWCIGYGFIAFSIAALLLWFAFRKKRMPDRETRNEYM
jgi:hypothetical protein